MSLDEEVKEALDGMNFFTVFYSIKADYKKMMHDAMYENFICTYRPVESLDVMYEAMLQAGKIVKYEIDEVTADEAHDMLKNGGLVSLFRCKLYCVELNNVYDSLAQMAEDLMIYRISGMMDKELEGMPTKE